MIKAPRHPGQRRRRLRRDSEPDTGPAPVPPVCQHCSRPILYGKVLSCGPVLLHESCLQGWRDRSALPLV